MKSCQKCHLNFEITQEDRNYYEKIEVPEPTLCPRCRAQRRLAWRNERKLYVTQSGLSGKRIVSVISPDKAFKVYESEEWWSDQYKPLDYGREFDFKRPFFEQFSALLKDVPHMNLIGSNNENCGYCHLLANCKHCYMIVESSNNEDCLYGYWLQKCLAAVDTSYTHNSQYVYEVDNCYNCYNLKWSSDCTNSSDSYFLKNCNGVKNSFGCVNLQQKEYCIFNEQKTKEEYEAFISELDLESHEQLNHWKKAFEEFKLQFPQKYNHSLNAEDCTGDYIINSRHCQDCYHAHDAEFCKYGEHVWRGSRNNMDVSTAGRDAEWIYESINTGISSNNVQFAVQNWSCSDMRYSYGCFNSQNNFGCVGLKRNQYCILNKQYTKEEYETLVEKIIEHMKQTGEWGEFFDPQFSPFGYNETVAQEQYPLNKEEALEKGFTWSDYSPPPPNVERTIPAQKLPDHNKDIPDDVLNWAIECEVSQKPFKLIKEELNFYHEHKIPIPRQHPDLRHEKRIKSRNPNQLWDRTCDNCQKKLQSPYSPEKLDKVYCEACYLEKVY